MPNCGSRILAPPLGVSPSPLQRSAGSGLGGGGKRCSQGQQVPPGMTASSPQPSPPKEERETDSSAGDSVMRPDAATELSGSRDCGRLAKAIEPMAQAQNRMLPQHA